MITIPHLQQHQQQIAASNSSKKSNKHNRDTVDYVHELEEDVPLTMPNAFDDDNQYIDQQDSVMHNIANDIEFSDVEEVPRMTRVSTRSQSRAKENSLPPTSAYFETEDILQESTPVQTKPLKRNKKKITEKVRRRRAVREDPTSDGDEIEY